MASFDFKGPNVPVEDVKDIPLSRIERDFLAFLLYEYGHDYLENLVPNEFGEIPFSNELRKKLR